MKFNRTKNATRTFFFGLLTKLITILFPFIIRTIIIYKLGAEYVGLTSLFTSVLQILNVSELGISSAISFCLYKPIAEDDKKSINALIALMKKLYKIIGCVILGTGLIIIPFLKHFISGTYPESVNIYILYIIYLLNAVVSYFGYAYKSILFEAYQKGDVNHKILAIVEVLKYIMQIIVLICFANYYWFAALLPFSSILVTIITEINSKKQFPEIEPKGVVSEELKIIIRKKVLFLSAHSIAATLTNSIDNIVISSSLGLIATAIYGNYFYIFSSITSIIVILFRAIKPVVGNSIYSDSTEKKDELFGAIQFLIYWIAIWTSTSLLCLYQPFMKVWVGDAYVLGISSVMMIVLYYYSNIIKLSYSNIYIDAAGLWDKTLLRQIAVAIINLVLDVTLVNKFGIEGIVFASFFATALIGLPLDVIVTYKYILEKDTKSGLLNTGLQFIIATCICMISYFICSNISINNVYINIFINVIICCVVPNLTLFLMYRNSYYFKFLLEHINSLIKRNRYISN